jgi:hypothetical protein
MRYVLIFVISIFIFTSCSYDQYSATSAFSDAGTIYGNKSTTNQKIQYSCSMDLTVKNVDSSLQKIKAYALDQKGYINKIQNNSITIRIPSNKKDTALSNIKSMGKVTYFSVQGKDVTSDYNDYSIRLNNALKARERYLDLLEKAKDVETMVLVEKELERLNNTIELLKGKLNRLEHLVDYTTIEVTLFEKTQLGPLSYVGLGLYYPIKWLFVLN